MATRKAKEAPPEGKKGRATQRINIFLTPEQIEFLKKDKDGPSAAVRAMITEAMAMANLAKSVKKKK